MPYNTAILCLLLIFTATFTACTGKKANDGTDSDCKTHPQPDTLRVATLYSPTSYFIYRDEPMSFGFSQ